MPDVESTVKILKGFYKSLNFNVNIELRGVYVFEGNVVVINQVSKFIK
jgi:hypothetical protein